MRTTRPCRCWPKLSPARMIMDLCARRPALRRHRTTRGGVLLLARSRRRTSTAESGRLVRLGAGRCLCRALRGGAQTGADHRAALLEPCQAQVLRTGHAQEGADRHRSRAPDVLFAIEREINGLAPQTRLAVRQERSRPLVTDLEAWLRTERAKLSSKNPVAKAIQYSLKRWAAMIRFPRRRQSLLVEQCR